MNTPTQPADGVGALWRGFRHEFDGGETECFDHKDPDCKTCEPVVLIRESDYRTLAASKAGNAQATPTDAARVRDAERYLYLRDRATASELEAFATRRGTRLAADRVCDAGIDAALAAVEGEG